VAQGVAPEFKPQYHKKKKKSSSAVKCFPSMLKAWDSILSITKNIYVRASIMNG
jgi:hypothetical protein